MMKFTIADISPRNLNFNVSLAVFTSRAMLSAVLGVVILSVCPYVRHTRALWLIQRTYRQCFIAHERAMILVVCCQRSQRNSNGVTPNGGTK